MKAKEELKAMKSNYFLVIKGGATFMIDREQKDKVHEVLSNGDCKVISIQDEIIGVYSIIGIFTYDRYIKSKMVTADIEEKLQRLRNKVAAEETLELTGYRGIKFTDGRGA